MLTGSPPFLGKISNHPPPFATFWKPHAQDYIFVKTRSLICCFDNLIIPFENIVVMRCEIWYHLYNKKIEKTTMEERYVWVFFTFFKLYKWYQIAQNITENVPISHFRSSHLP